MNRVFWLASVSFFFMIVMMNAGCKKTTTFTYKAFCNSCEVSYFDESGNFVGQQPIQGIFEQKISVAEFGKVMIAIKSSVTDPALLPDDLIWVELKKENEIVCADSSNTGKVNHATTCSYNWGK